MLHRVYAIALWMVAAIGYAAAAETDVVSGVWKGTYECGGKVAQLSLIVDERGDRFIFGYPNGLRGEYSLKVSFNAKRRQLSADPIQWVDRPPGVNMVGFDAIVSAKVDAITGNVRGCGKLSLRKIVDEKLAEGILREHIRSTEPSPRKPKKTATSIYNSVWEGAWRGAAAKCNDSPLDVVFVVQPSGSLTGTARVLLRREGNAEWYEYAARTESMDTDTHLRLTVETPKGGPITRGMFDFDMNLDGSDFSKRITDSYRLGCKPFGMARLPEGEIPPASGADTAPVASIVGSWDGAIYSRRDRDRELALTITENASGSGDSAYDVVALTEGKTQRLVLKAGAEILEMVPAPTGNPSGVGPIHGGAVFTEIRYGGTRDLLVVRINGREEWAYLWRRNDNEPPLQTTCKTVEDTWVKSLRDATRQAREMKVALYPSLLDYDVNRAVLAEAVHNLPTMPGKGIADLRAVFFACAMTAPSGWLSDEKSSIAVLTDGGDIMRARSVMRSGFHPEAGRLKRPSTDVDISRIEDERRKAEDSVAAISFVPADLSSTNAILAAAQRSAASIQNARPSVAASALGPLMKGLDSREGIDGSARKELLRSFAERRMSGIQPPVGVLSPSAAALLGAVTSGRVGAFTPAEAGFLAGMISQSIERCSEPPETTRLLLLDMVKRGIQLLLGTDFGGDLSSALGSQFESHANIVDGANASKALGCGSPYMAAVYDILAFSPTNEPLPDGQRAPLFVRSCSLERTPSQCTCMKDVIQTIRPEAGNMTFDRSMISSAIAMNPTVGIELGTRCGLSNY